jgi:hypothetical protein
MYRIVLALLEQLYVQCPTTATEVRDLEIRDSQAHETPLPKLISVLMSVAARFQKTFIVLDALDECHSDAIPELDSMVRTISTSRCRLFVTARPSHGLTLFSDGDCPKIEIHASVDELERFIHTRLLQVSQKQEVFDSRQKEIIERALVRLGGQHGM